MALRLGLLLLIPLFFGCQSRAPSSPALPSPSPLPPPSPAQSPSPEATSAKTVNIPSVATADRGPVLAQLRSLNPKVSYKRRQELLWQDANHGLRFRRFDSVQTHENASATIQFVNGSELKLKQSSLAIINLETEPSPTSKRDRVVIRSGEAEGRTTRQFWILTSAALIRMEGENGKTESTLRLKVEEGKSLEVTLQKGTATILPLAPALAASPIPLQPESPLVLPAPKAQPSFGMSEVRVFEPPVARPPTGNQTTLASTKEPCELLVNEPQDRLETDTDSIRIRGQVSNNESCKVKLNGGALELTSSGAFDTTASLANGANLILLQLVRPDGTSAFARRTVIRK